MGETIEVDGANVVPEVHAVLDRMEAFAHSVRDGRWKGHTGLPIRNVVNIGIGGSDLGPVMAYEALRHYSRRDMTFRFVSNIDGTDFAEATRDLDPRETLFVVCSKTFTTLETLTNAHTARTWCVNALGDEAAVRRHFVAVSTNAEGVEEFGIDPANMFGFWDWVGGRYSMDSAIGLSTMLAVGPEHFREMLAGFHAMDRHFRTAPLERNLPVIMGLLAVWYADFFDARHRGGAPLRPVPEALSRLPPAADHGEQRQARHPRRRPRGLPDESHRLGGAGYQRAAFVLPADPPGDEAHPLRLHRLLPVAQPVGPPPRPAHGQRVRADGGAGVREDGEEVEAEGTPARLVPHRVFEGNRPTSTILADRLTPEILGSLVALYEHSVFTQGVIWGIDSFDQWGVELGQEPGQAHRGELQGDGPRAGGHDSSTMALMRRYMRAQGASVEDEP